MNENLKINFWRLAILVFSRLIHYREHSVSRGVSRL